MSPILAIAGPKGWTSVRARRGLAVPVELRQRVEAHAMLRSPIGKLAGRFQGGTRRDHRRVKPWAERLEERALLAQAVSYWVGDWTVNDVDTMTVGQFPPHDTPVGELLITYTPNFGAPFD